MYNITYFIGLPLKIVSYSHVLKGWNSKYWYIGLKMLKSSAFQYTTRENNLYNTFEEIMLTQPTPYVTGFEKTRLPRTIVSN